MRATRDPISRETAAAPLDATVAVDAVELARGVVFQVTAEWHSRGPAPADGQVDERTTFVRYYDAANLELARAIAGVALQLLAGGAEPDLQDIARVLKGRGTITLNRQRIGAEGAAILGDVAPGE